MVRRGRNLVSCGYQKLIEGMGEMSVLICVKDGSQNKSDRSYQN